MNPAWYLAAILVSAILTALLRRHARKIIVLDVPNERSSHAVPTPRGGGLAVVLTFVLFACGMVLSGLVSFSLFITVTLPGLVVAAIGLVDDVRGVRPMIRLLFHCTGAGLFLALVHTTVSFGWGGAVRLPVPLFLLAAVPGLVWCVNLHNFMDGIDGIASVEAITVAGGAALIILMNHGVTDHGSLLLLLASAVAGFLIWNWPPAKIFMGDGCSGFLGLTIGMFAILTSSAGLISLWSWLILYSVFVVDATWTLLRRICRGEKFYLAHCSHAYQIGTRALGSHKKMTLGVLAINIAWLFPLAVVSSTYPGSALYCFAAAYLPFLVAAVWIGAGSSGE